MRSVNGYTPAILDAKIVDPDGNEYIKKSLASFHGLVVRENNSNIFAPYTANMLKRIDSIDLGPLQDDKNFKDLLKAMKDFLVGNIVFGSGNIPQHITKCENKDNENFILLTNETDVFINFLQGHAQAGVLDRDFTKYCKANDIDLNKINGRQSSILRDVLSPNADRDQNALEIITLLDILNTPSTTRVPQKQTSHSSSIPPSAANHSQISAYPTRNVVRVNAATSEGVNLPSIKTSNEKTENVSSKQIELFKAAVDEFKNAPGKNNKSTLPVLNALYNLDWTQIQKERGGTLVVGDVDGSLPSVIIPLFLTGKIKVKPGHEEEFKNYIKLSCEASIGLDRDFFNKKTKDAANTKFSEMMTSNALEFSEGKVDIVYTGDVLRDRGATWITMREGRPYFKTTQGVLELAKYLGVSFILGNHEYATQVGTGQQGGFSVEATLLESFIREPSEIQRDDLPLREMMTPALLKDGVLYTHEGVKMINDALFQGFGIEEEKFPLLDNFLDRHLRGNIGYEGGPYGEVDENFKPVEFNDVSFAHAHYDQNSNITMFAITPKLLAAWKSEKSIPTLAEAYVDLCKELFMCKDFNQHLVIATDEDLFVEKSPRDAATKANQHLDIDQQIRGHAHTNREGLESLNRSAAYFPPSKQQKDISESSQEPIHTSTNEPQRINEEDDKHSLGFGPLWNFPSSTL